MAILAQTPLIVKSMKLVEGTNYPSVVFGNFALLYILYVVFSVIFLIFLIIKLRKKSMGLEYLQISYISVGMVIAGVLAVFTNVILPIITGSSSSAFWGPVAVGIFGTITTYTITQHRLFGLKYLLERFLYHLLIITPPYLIALLVLYYYPRLNLGMSTLSRFFVILFITVTTIGIFTTFKNYMDKKFSPGLGSADGDIEEIRENFLRTISTELNLDKLGILTLKAIDKIFDLKKSGVIIFNADNASIIYKKLYEFGEQPLDNQNLLQVIYYWDNLGHSTTITKDELSNQKNLSQQQKRILHFMEKDDIEVVLPLNRKVHLNGVVVLGGKNSRNPFTVEDIKYLEALIINSSVAFSRSILYSQVEELNASLQQKVDLQTQELKRKVKQLEEARRKEADMIDIMGHELRTPMSIVKLNTDLLSNFTENITKRKEDFNKYVKRIKDAVDTEIKLINTLLSSAKLEGNKIDLNPEEVDIIEQIKMSVDAYEGRAEKKGLVLRTEFEPNTPSVYGDHARIVEILNNLIDNAVKYTEKGSVLVKTETEGDFVRTSVIDTGQGMGEEDIERLGTKFFRTSNYINSHESDDINIVRPGGTGLGLYVTFNLVRQMGGEIEVDSELGKGSNFSFTLPQYNGQKSDKIYDTNDMFERLGLKKENQTTEKIQQ